MTAGVLVARMMEGMQFTLGPTMAFRRETMRRMGGFRVTADYCADDFVLGNETFKLGQKVVLSHHADRSHRDQRQPGAVAQAPGALDEVDALLAAQGALRNRAHVQHAVRAAGAWRGDCCWHHAALGVGAAGVGGGFAAGAVDCGGQLGGAATELVQPAGALSDSRPDGVLLLGGELLGEPHSVARAGVSAAARREDAGGEIG